MTGRIVLLRHGETEWSANGRHTGRTDIPLTDAGRELAVAAGRLLAAIRDSGPPGGVLRTVACSPMHRARATAALAGLDPVTDDRLHEWDYGDYEGLTTPQIREKVPGWTVWSHPCPGGESAAQVGERADDVLCDYRSRLEQGDVVLVGHGHFSRVLTARWLNLPATSGVGFKLDAGGLTVLGDERGLPRLDHVNLVTS
jgi:probable phosphoglycerate mutase